MSLIVCTDYTLTMYKYVPNTYDHDQRAYAPMCQRSMDVGSAMGSAPGHHHPFQCPSTC